MIQLLFEGILTLQVGHTRDFSASPISLERSSVEDALTYEDSVWWKDGQL
jgi:hypothetical protein